MEVHFTGRHYEIAPELREYITRKLEKLVLFQNGIREARVTLSAENYRLIAEVGLQARRRLFTSREESADMYLSVDQVIEKLAEQLKRYKEKRISRGRRNPRQPALDAGPALPVISLRDTMEQPEPLSVDEALNALDEEGGEVLVFENTANKRTTVIYRREDGSYGLIEPTD